VDYDEELENRVKDYECRLAEALRYVNWCRDHSNDIDVPAALWKIRLLLLGCGKLIVDVIDTLEA